MTHPKPNEFSPFFCPPLNYNDNKSSTLTESLYASKISSQNKSFLVDAINNSQ
jgi:hypothetical protein